MIALQPDQAGFNRMDHMVPRGPPVIRPVTDLQTELGRQHKPVPSAFERFAQRLLGPAFDIDICGINKVDTNILGGVHDGIHILLRDGVRTKPVGPKSDHRHLHASHA